MAATSEFKVELPAELRKMAGRGTPSPVTHALVTIHVPDGLDPQGTAPILIVSATSDAAHQSSRRLLAEYAKAALPAGWIAIAADPGPAVAPADDLVSLRLALNNAALAVLRKQRPTAAAAPLAFAGFSGGAKYSAWLAAAFARQGRVIAGLFLAGMNEETLVGAARHFDVLDARFRRVPVFLHAGANDAVAPPESQRAIAEALRGAGFEAVRTVSSTGGHQVDMGPLREALEWFGKLDPEPSPQMRRP